MREQNTFGGGGGLCTRFALPLRGVFLLFVPSNWTF